VESLAKVFEQQECSSYDLNDANRDAAQLHRLHRKATLATAMLDQEIESLRHDMEVLEARRKEILEPINQEMQYLRDCLTAYHKRTLESGGDKTIKLPWATLKSRQQAQDYERDDAALLAWAQANATEYVKTAAPTVAWGDLKKAIVVAGGKAILKETGEPVPGLQPKEREVKYDVEVL
jgi:hypothetical protein